MKKRKFVRDEWRVLSEKFVNHHGLPAGTKIVLEHEPIDGRRKGRKARNDMTVTHRPFTGRAHDEETVNDLFEDHLLPSLLTDPTEKGLRLHLIGPNGETVNKKNMKIKTVRSWEPLETASELYRQQMREELIEEIAEYADLDIRVAEEEQEDFDAVLRGYLRALVRRYRFEAVRAALKDEADD